MEKHFSGLRPEDVKGLSKWFWYKDGWATATAMYIDLLTDTSYYEYYKYYDWALIAILCIVSPLIYLVMPFVTTFYAERNILKRANDNNGEVQFTAYSKSAIEYFTIIQTLRRRERD